MTTQRQRTRTAETPEVDGRIRVVIEGVTPQVDCGRYPIKRVPDEAVTVEADVFCDGHDAIAVVLRHRKGDDGAWFEQPMEPLINDRWRASFTVSELGRYRYTVQAWVDRFESWRRDTQKKIDAGQDVSVELLAGAEIVAGAATRAKGRHKQALKEWAEQLGAEEPDPDLVSNPELIHVVAQYPDRSGAATYERELEILVDPPDARFSAWYELFPRSTAPGRHGTFADVEKQLDYVAGMGFDILYLPPIHPIGRTHRKGRNNTAVASEDDVGSPWAIGSEDGGHTAIHPELGTMEDFERLVAEARRRGLEIALDIAYQCSPDHPWVKEHPEWFRHRPDGTIQYAENPPKKYQDIYPLDFESADWEGLWQELKGVVDFWIGKGVRVFRVDNPHTKAFGFWEWMIGEVKRSHPEVIFLSEAFTRPRVMERLAKLGFSQSYTYFTWRNTRWELMQYISDLTQTDLREYFRPNLWPNTPDILPEYLQYGGRPAFMTRLVLAATLGASYGIYGPAFEQYENVPVEAGKEEYLHSEKYELRDWDLSRQDSLRDLIARVNEIRRDNPALHSNDTLRFHETANEALVAYSKTAGDGSNIIVCVVSLDPHHGQAGSLELPISEWDIAPDRPYQVHDLLTEARYIWQGTHNYVELGPHGSMAHIFRLRHRIRSEHDFDYFM